MEGRQKQIYEHLMKMIHKVQSGGYGIGNNMDEKAIEKDIFSTSINGESEDSADPNICKDCGKPMGNPLFCVWCAESNELDG